MLTYAILMAFVRSGRAAQNRSEHFLKKVFSDLELPAHESANDGGSTPNSRSYAEVRDPSTSGSLRSHDGPQTPNDTEVAKMQQLLRKADEEHRQDNIDIAKAKSVLELAYHQYIKVITIDGQKSMVYVTAESQEVPEKVESFAKKHGIKKVVSFVDPDLKNKFAAKIRGFTKQKSRAFSHIDGLAEDRNCGPDERRSRNDLKKHRRRSKAKKVDTPWIPISGYHEENYKEWIRTKHNCRARLIDFVKRGDKVTIPWQKCILLERNVSGYAFEETVTCHIKLVETGDILKNIPETDIEMSYSTICKEDWMDRLGTPSGDAKVDADSGKSFPIAQGWSWIPPVSYYPDHIAEMKYRKGLPDHIKRLHNFGNYPALDKFKRTE